MVKETQIFFLTIAMYHLQDTMYYLVSYHLEAHHLAG